MRATLLRGALLALAACGRRQEGEPAVDLPPRTTAVAVEPAGPDSVTITLTKDGRILARGRAWSIEGLDGLLARALRRDPVFAHYATTAARLRIDRAVPWLHVRWLVDAVGVQGVRQVRFVYEAGEGETDLPCSVLPSFLQVEAMAPPPGSQVLHARICIGEEGSIRCGDLRAADPEAVTEWMAGWAAKVRGEGLVAIHVEVAADDAAPWGVVAAVNERARAAGASNVAFAGGYVGAPDEIHGATRLWTPAPKRAVRGAGAAAWGLRREGGGVDVFPDWPRGGAEFTPAWPDEDEVPEKPLPEEKR